MIVRARPRSPIDLAQEIAAELATFAPEWDQTGKFPTAALMVLRASGLMGMLVPREYGGLGSSYADFARCARILGAGCTSTAVSWAMHCQQVAVLAQYAPPSLRERVLPRIAAGEIYIASVTTEAVKGGHLLSCVAPVVKAPDGFAVRRMAPVVSGGEHADAFLITMRRDPEAPTTEVVLAYAECSQIGATVRGDWDAMGMRATGSIPMELDGIVPEDQVFSSPRGFPALATSTMIPVGHIAWSASWLGAAEGVFRRYIAIARDPENRKRSGGLGDVALDRLARARMKIDLVAGYLANTVRNYETLVAREGYHSPTFVAPQFNIEINTLKVVASETLFEAAHLLLQIAGLRHGYLKGSALGLERVLRDLASASLMYSNDRLTEANGKLCLLDRDLARLDDELPREPDTEIVLEPALQGEGP